MWRGRGSARDAVERCKSRESPVGSREDRGGEAVVAFRISRARPGAIGLRWLLYQARGASMTRFLASSLCIALCSPAWGQAPASQVEPQNGFTITRLPPATYPPIALAAHVYGDVVLKIALRPDGAIDSVEAESGPAMLRQSAIDSAKQAQFRCEVCNGMTTSFRVTLRFELGPTIYCAETKDGSYPRVTQSKGIVMIAAQPFGTCDLAADRIPVRSAKCLFLWKCGSR
jgi:TonB family protein